MRQRRDLAPTGAAARPTQPREHLQPERRVAGKLMRVAGSNCMRACVHAYVHASTHVWRCALGVGAHSARLLGINKAIDGCGSRREQRGRTHRDLDGWTWREAALTKSCSLWGEGRQQRQQHRQSVLAAEGLTSKR
eukprot:365063-Chlamydomonas_euryale.AAC.11